MAEYNFTVDTTPLAEGLDTIGHNVNAVSTAVVAMQTAVVLSEKEAADKICKSIDSGFFMLLRARLSRRVAEFASTMSSRAASMLETGSAIEHTHQQMQGDFLRIKSRYVKVFDKLDRELDQRVRELDRPAMTLAKVRREVLVDRQCKDAPGALYYAADGAIVSLKASNARVKARASESIAQLGAGMQLIEGYERATQSVFEGQNHASRQLGASYEYVPVVYTVAENQVTPGAYSLEVQTPSALDPKTQADIARGVRRGQGRLTGSNARDINAVRASFVEKTRSAQLDDRVAQTMIGLFDASFGGTYGTGDAR